ncbi:pilus assembly protein TadG-related protein [Schumannella soli]|uniref:Putative Flp pilus-assembly TadG-like N-terminal domain-containing protein n=1 Tax=Schumannella soli TaxID=2590779 RepID=A0A506Y1R5_9MICO|nr:pilus assembly protein TadG-related protein [Schumannella soli]TPW75912.1 hypothetical protein FJ657_08685 [Schumannella soli]
MSTRHRRSRRSEPGPDADTLATPRDGTGPGAVAPDDARLAVARPRFLVRLRDEDGSTLPLIAAFAALALALILVVAAASSLYLERKRLFTVADGAALAAAESFDLDDEGGEDRAGPQLDDVRVRAAAEDYLASAPSPVDDTALESAATPDGRSAVVRLSGYWRPPLLSLAVPEGLRIEVTARARSVYG